MIKTVVGSFDSISEAATAARDLRTAGFGDSDVNVIANNTRAVARDDKVVDDAASGAATGIVAGGDGEVSVGGAERLIGRRQDLDRCVELGARPGAASRGDGDQQGLSRRARRHRRYVVRQHRA